MATKLSFLSTQLVRTRLNGGGRTAALFWLGLSLLRVAAFESWEHEGCSQLALQTAYTLSGTNLVFATNRDPNRLKRDVEAFLLHGIGDCSCGRRLTYGRVTMLADYMPDPYSMTHPNSSSQAWPEEPAGANLEYLKNVGNDTLGYFNASHNNHNHFQGRALFSFWMWHREAVNTAAGGNLWGALLLNAYADHYLQDSFAPGHILAPRNEASDDVVSLALHDSFNRSGLGYRLAKASVLLPFLNAALAIPPGSNSVMEISDRELRASGADGAGRSAGWVTIPVGNLRSFHAACANTNLTELTVDCLGDGQSEVIRHQLPLMISYCARSAYDLLESYASGEARNSFPGYTWRVRFHKNAASINPSAWIENGQISLPFAGLECAPPSVPRKVSEVPLLSEVLGFDAAGEGKSVEGDLLEAAKKNPMFGVGFGIQSLAETGESHIRSIVDGDILVYGNRRFDRYGIPLRWYVPEQWAVAVGYSGIIAPSSSAHGPELRFIVPFSKVNARASLIAGARAYSRDHTEVWGDFETLRLEWGMHLGNLFIGVGHDHYLDAVGELNDGLSIEAGLSFSGPLSRFPVLGRPPRKPEP